MRPLAVILGVAWPSLAMGAGILKGQQSLPKEREDRFAFGQVITVQRRSMTIVEYDFSKEATVTSTYFATHSTEFGNLDSLRDLQPGDQVVMDFELRGRKRILVTLVKEEDGGGECVAEDRSVFETMGRLLLTETFQQIGDTIDGGGIARAVAGVMALTTTNSEQAACFAEVANTAAPSLSWAEATSLSGFNRGLTNEELPTNRPPDQVQQFGLHRLEVWCESDVGAGDAVVALWRTNRLQFAFRGHGLSAMGPYTDPDGQLSERMEGPPAGRDLDLDGAPDLLVYDYSGGAHCCSAIKHIACGDPPVLVAQISGWHSTPRYEDIDGDGRYELLVNDCSYAYWNACYADSPQPLVIFRIRNGRYEMAGDLMRREGPSPEEVASIAAGLRHRLARVDHYRARREMRGDRGLSAEGEADNEFFPGFAWRNEEVIIPSPVWELLLDLIYSGRVEEALHALDAMWPAGRPGQGDFTRDLMDVIAASWYGQRLPWYRELVEAVLRRNPGQVHDP